MEKFGKSQSILRREDDRFITGAGQYVDDTAPDGALQAYVFRSIFAHGTITTLDVDDARTADGVQCVITADDLQNAGVVLPMTATILTNRDGTRAPHPDHPLLAQGKVRFVGEPVAMVIADTLAQARAAAELIWFDVEEQEAKLDLHPGGPLLHDDAPGNIAFDWYKGDDAAVSAALDSSAHKLTFDIADNRIICASIEPRGCWAAMEDGRLHLCVNGQGVWGQKAQLAQHLGMDADAIRVTNPDVGGGFGMKAMTYPEYFVVAHAARQLNRPVRWMSDRSEAMLTDNAGRDLTTRVTMGFDADLKFTAYRAQSRINMGAYTSQYAQPIQTELFAKVLTGVYNVPVADLAVVGIYTNTTQVDAYRGAGRPEAIYALERAMDYAAHALGVDPIDLRRRNFIRPEQFPYVTPMGVSYDIGDFDLVMNAALAHAPMADFEHRRAQAKAAGKLLGRGLCFYIESILGSPTETSRVVFEPGGRVSLYAGTQSNGQGHETVFAQYLADQSGIAFDQIDVIMGDSDRIKTGGGTGGSRSGTVQNTATLQTVDRIVQKFTAFLADHAGVAPDKVSFDAEVFRIDGSNTTYAMVDVADMARNAGRSDMLDHSETITLDGNSFPNGVHIAEAMVDPETGASQITRYDIVDDFGHLLNPMIVAGQVHGGVAQGLGQAMLEHVTYDETGQPITASFMDYAMPRAGDVPAMKFNTVSVPSTTNPIGMKGCGEAGTIGAMAAVANAMMDALRQAGVDQADMPFTPHRVWQMLHSVKA